MFLDNLSRSLLHIIDIENLTYEKVAEKCNLSVRFICKMVYKAAAPTIRTLEKLCTGLKKTPNELLGINTADEEELSYRKGMEIKEVKCLETNLGKSYYPVCPRCNRIIDREYQEFCDSCGQKLEWSKLNEAKVIDNHSADRKETSARSG